MGCSTTLNITVGAANIFATREHNGNMCSDSSVGTLPGITTIPLSYSGPFQFRAYALKGGKDQPCVENKFISFHISEDMSKFWKKVIRTLCFLQVEIINSSWGRVSIPKIMAYT